jgi:citrate lyase beta subunit
MKSTREDWATVRCLFEAPILDERKWKKIPSIPADAFILDLEDSAPLDRKEEARAKVVEYLGKPDYFNGALVVPRANHLDTPWGRDDLIAFAEAGAEVVMYPKANSPEDVRAVVDLMAEHGTTSKVVVCIESARGVVEVERTFAMDEVVAGSFGPGDLHVDAGYPLYGEDGEINPTLIYPKSRFVHAGAAFGVPHLGIAFMPDIKDLADVRRRIVAEHLLGFTGLAAFYPPHVEIINEVYTPSEQQLDHARHIIEVYEAAVAEGNPAVQLANGTAVLVHHYKEAQDTLARVR